MSNPDIQKSISIKTSSEEVFKAISDEKELQKWWVDVPRLEQKVGGSLEFKFLKENSEMLQKDYVVKGKILEIIPNKKLVYTWNPVDEPELAGSVVTWILQEDSNQTKVTVIHSGLDNCKSYHLLVEGWSYFISRLGHLF